MTKSTNNKRTNNRKLDIVIPYKAFSNIYNLELKYCLRSIEKHLTGYRNIVIVGDLPSFIDEDKVIFIPKDKTFYKEKDIAHSLYILNDNKDISSNFVMFNDDFFVNQDFDLRDLPTYTREYSLYDHVYSPERRKNRWKYYTRVIERTYRELKKNDLPIVNYDIHKPMKFNKKKVVEVFDFFDWSDPKGMGFTFRSLYGNYNKLPFEAVPDFKVNSITSKVEKKLKENNIIFWSTGDSMKAKPFEEYMESRFPDKSRYEI